jgi:hypothetical protein
VPALAGRAARQLVLGHRGARLGEGGGVDVGRGQDDLADDDAFRYLAAHALEHADELAERRAQFVRVGGTDIRPRLPVSG